jgi:hypothetical protein
MNPYNHHPQGKSCKHCGKKLRSFPGFSNDSPHRKYHKKCFREIVKSRPLWRQPENEVDFLEMLLYQTDEYSQEGPYEGESEG